MPTRFREGTSLPKRLMFYTFAFAVNSTEVSLVAASTLALKTALDFDVEDVVRTGAAYTAAYLIPGGICWEYVKNVDKAYAAGKLAVKYSKKGYSIARKVSSPIEFINYVTAKGVTKFGLVEGMKNFCNVEDCDAFVWEHPELEDVFS